MTSFVAKLAGKYEINYRCANCDIIGRLRILKGLPVSEFLKDNPDAICENCGCAIWERDILTMKNINRTMKEAMNRTYKDIEDSQFVNSSRKIHMKGGR